MVVKGLNFSARRSASAKTVRDPRSSGAGGALTVSGAGSSQVNLPNAGSTIGNPLELTGVANWTTPRLSSRRGGSREDCHRIRYLGLRKIHFPFRDRLHCLMVFTALGLIDYAASDTDSLCKSA